jgi:hypothetical protein
MKWDALKIRNAIFWALIVNFAAMVAAIAGQNRFWGHKTPFPVFASLIIAFGVLGAALVVITAKLRESGVRKLFFVLAGASAAGFLICGILHNLVYALCVKLGWGFCGSGGDEAVFFILGLFVCPALFAIGTLGGIVLLISARFGRKE